MYTLEKQVGKGSSAGIKGNRAYMGPEWASILGPLRAEPEAVGLLEPLSPLLAREPQLHLTRAKKLSRISVAEHLKSIFKKALHCRAFDRPGLRFSKLALANSPTPGLAGPGRSV